MAYFRVLIVAWCGVVSTTTARAAEPVIVTLSVMPTAVTLASADDSAQLIVSGATAEGREFDFSSTANYKIADANLVSVSPTGRVTPLADGQTTITILAGGKSISVPIVTKQIGVNLPINFPNQIVPIFTKLGCNSGGCHGKASGQNGFKISLLGFEPELDYTTLVKDSRGRRLFPAAPDSSLFLLKAIGAIPHGGGKKLDPASDEYKLIRRWIASGMPWGEPTDPTLVRIRVSPAHRILTRQSVQQFAVYADYSDGHTEDITRRTQFETNEPEIATVDGAGLVRTMKLSGEAAIMARYQGMVATFRATVPLDLKTPAWTFESNNSLDALTAKKWRELGLVPSQPIGDEAFLRRVSLDITGTLPTPKQVTEFVAEQSKNKRTTLVDRLLETPEYSFYFANKWADILRVKRRGEANRAQGTASFHNWIREAIARDMPYSDFARAIVSATGTETTNPPSVWYKEIDKPEQFVDDVSQVFLGQRLNCANCHHHPYEKWSQDDYWGLAAFYGRVGRKEIPQAVGDISRPQNKDQSIYITASGTVTNKRTNQPALLKPLDAAVLEVDATDDPRQKLADWMTDTKNPFFARTVANRYWAHFFSRGIVDPLDDMRITNPPSNPELLDALAKIVTDNRYSLKALVRAICTSRTYQLSSIPNEFNTHDKQAYARYYPKRLSAEVLLDAVNQITNTPQRFGNLPGDAHAPTRAIMLPDESYSSYFLEVFGKPQRISACECERVNEANLAQALHLLNSDDVQNKLTRGGGRAELFTRADDKRPDREKITELFLWAFARNPSEAEMTAAMNHLNATVKKSGPTAKRAAYENLVWALLNTKEFVFNQ